MKMRREPGRYSDLTTAQLLDQIAGILNELQRREAERFRLKGEVIRPKTDYEEEV